MLQLENITIRFGEKPILLNSSLAISDSEKVGIVGVNGTGKSTLLKIMAQVLVPDSGSITMRQNLRLSYLPQDVDFRPGMSILDACFSPLDETSRLVGLWKQASEKQDDKTMEILLPKMDALGAWDYERRAEEILHQLSITDISRSVDTLSGGERKRVALAGTLIAEPQFLIADEPTNHLDLESIEWLENYFSRSRLTLVLVTHDRYFLDRVCQRIIEVDHHSLYSYNGNYATFLEQRNERVASQESIEQKLRNRYRKELEWMRRQPQARGGKQKGRKDAFSDLESRIETLQQIAPEDSVEFSSITTRLGNKVVVLDQISKSFGDKKLFENFTYTFARNERIGIIGPNGSGKTTLLRILQQEIAPDRGNVEIGETVRFGYYGQLTPAWDESKRAIDIITDIAEHITDPETGISITAGKLLQRFLFSPEKQYTPVQKLSGGEKRRLFLCSVLMTNPNFIILDEPTNDLDLVTLSVLEEFLLRFKGCVVVVSHDRYFMDKIVDHLFVLSPSGKVIDYPGTFTQYRSSSTRDESTLPKQNTPKEDSRPQRVTKKRTYKEEQEYIALEEKIATLEEEIQVLQTEMSNGMQGDNEIREMADRYQALTHHLDEASERWLELAEKG